MEIKLSEHECQVLVMGWIFSHLLEYPELDLVFSVPNGARLGSGKVAAIRANSLKAEGMRPGCPDLVIPSPRGGYFGMFLEMKAKNGRLHPSQEQFIVEAEKYGYFGAVAFGADEAIEILEGYLSKPYTRSTFDSLPAKLDNRKDFTNGI